MIGTAEKNVLSLDIAGLGASAGLAKLTVPSWQLGTKSLIDWLGIFPHSVMYITQPDRSRRLFSQYVQ
jgi:hypothetical protein